jgi:TIR domain
LATDDHPDDNGGLPDRSLSFDEILQMTREEAAQVVGVHAWDVAHLTQLLNQALATTPEPPDKPPSVFLSYRWESEEHRAWVTRLAHDLKARGYDVYFDQDLQVEHHDQLMPAPELISLIVRCNFFVMVLTEGYLERIGPSAQRASIKLMDGWVWDEYQTALQLVKIGRINSWLIVWRSGELPDWTTEEEVWDFRDDAQYEALVDEAFPRRLANIIGIRADGSMRLVGPIERVRVNEVGRRLETEDEFEQVNIQHL